MGAKASPDALPDVVGMGNVRFPPTLPDGSRALPEAGHIGYHVRPDARRQGIGKAVLTHAVLLCEKGGIPSPTVCVLEDNLPSLRTAFSCGFVREGRGVLPTGEEFLTLRLPEPPR